MKKVDLFTDGACSGNPGPGGWAFVLRHDKSEAELEGSGGEPDSTNNRMEMMAVICGLEKLIEPCQVSLYSDSIYVLKGMQEWMPKWKAQGWQRRGVKNKKEPVKNIELWKKLDELKEIHEISYHKVKGHSGHPENERCDFLAVEACAKADAELKAAQQELDKAREDNRCND